MARGDSAGGLSGAVGALAVGCSRRAKTVLGLVVVVTVVLGLGLGQIQLRSADYDLMPTWHPSFKANEVALQRIPGFRSIETVYLELSPGYLAECRQQSDPDGWCVTNEPVVRALEEANAFLRRGTNAKMSEAAGREVNVLRYEYSLSYLVKLVNYSVAINPLDPNDREPASFSLPPDSATFNAYYNGLYEGARPAIEGILNEEGTATILVFMYDLDTTKRGPEAVLPASKAFLDTVLEYREFLKQGKSAFGAHEILNTERVYVLGELINAHSTALANEDFRALLPYVFLAILGLMLIQFRSPRVVIVTFSALLLGVVWTYGLMGHLRMPLDFFSMLIVPISLGAGVDYAIHFANEHAALRSEGMPPEIASRRAGETVGAALVIAAMTTIVGFLAIVPSSFSPMINLGLLGAFLFVAVLLATIVVIPALLAVVGAPLGKPYREAVLTRRTAGFLRRHRLTAIGLFLAGSALVLPGVGKLTPYFEISGGFHEGDYVRESYEYYNAHWGGAGTELLTVIPPRAGDVADPVTMAYVAAIDYEFKNNLTEIVPRASNVNSLRIAIDTYETLKSGVQSVGGTVIFKRGDTSQYNIPPSREGVVRDIREMYADPVFASLAALFVDEDASVTVVHIFYEIRGGSFSDLERAWNLMTQGIADASRSSPPLPGTRTDLVGTQDTFYLYVKHGYPWIGLVTLGSTLAVIVLIALFLRRARDVVAVAVPMVVTTAWWFGILPWAGIQVSLTLMLPIIFITAIGSDYAVQYVWNLRRMGDPDRVFGVVGKGVLFSMVTTVVAFLIFSRGNLVLASQSALATALAILVIYVVTLLLVPPIAGRRAGP